MIKSGQVLNDTYEVIERIGSGGGGIIYKAYHKRMKKYVAVKLIKDDIKGKLQDRSEVDMLKNLKNDHLPQVIDFVEDGNDVYTVMEFIEGQNFKQLISSGHIFDENKVKKYALQLCKAVEYLHAQEPPIIHSDIKPANVMLTPNDNICLIDFNISLIANSGANMALGASQGFAAPEQFKRLVELPDAVDEFHEETRFIGDEETEILLEDENISSSEVRTKNTAKAFIDMRTDIYGIGATIYYILTSRTPVSGFVDFRGIKCSSAIKNIITKAMNIDPNKRYKNVSEMIKAIEHIPNKKLKLVKVTVKREKLQSTQKKKNENKNILKLMLCSLPIIVAAVFVSVLINNMKENMQTNLISSEIASAQSYLQENSYDQAIAEFKKTIEIVSVDDQNNTDIIEYYPNGAVKCQKTKDYDDDGYELTWYDENSIKLYTDFYKNGIQTKRINYNNDGTVKNTIEYDENGGEIKQKQTTTISTDVSTTVTETATEISSTDNGEYVFIGSKLYSVDLVELDLHGCNLTDSDIKNISKMKNLEILWLNENNINDISPLSDLISLKELHLGDNNISDLKPLSKLINLKELYLAINNIENVEPLSNLTNLTLLSIRNNNVSDISCLYKLTKLEQFSANNNKISDISVMRNFKSLQIAWLHNNKIDDISPLSGLSYIVQLHIGGNGIKDIEALSSLSDMHYLYLDNNNVSDIGALSNMKKLIKLDLDNNNVNNVMPLRECVNLSELHLYNNDIDESSAQELNDFIPECTIYFVLANKYED